MMNEQLKRADERAKAAEKKVMNKMMIMMAAVVVVTRMTMLKLLLWVIMVVKLRMQPNKPLLPFILFSLNLTFCFPGRRH